MRRPPVILLVEDNPANQMLAVALLEREGYQVDLASTS
jgi:CheY-like chemotaxis protein